MDGQQILEAELPDGPLTLGADGQTPVVQANAVVVSQDGNETSPEQGCVEMSSADTATAGVNARRTLKLVVTLQPIDGAGYGALLALGADGCDPLFRSVAVADLPAALDEVPALAAEAETRWQAQPRYPTVVPQRAKTAAQRARPAEVARPDGQASRQDGPTQPSRSSEARPKHPVSGPTATTAPAGQLSLFQ